MRSKGLTLDMEAATMMKDTESSLPIANLNDRAGSWITYCAFFCSGAGSIAMWSCITLCLTFFDAKYPEDRVGFVFPVVNMSTLLIISLYMVMAGRQLSLDARMHRSLASHAAFVLLLPLVNVLTLPHDVGYPLTLLALMGSTVSSSIMQSSMYGLGGVFGSMYIQAIEGGKGFGAILLFALRLALKWSLEDDVSNDLARTYYDKVSMAVFFSVAFVMVAATWVLYWAMLRTSFAQPLLTEYALVQHETPVTLPISSPLSSPVSPLRRYNVFSSRESMNERSPLLANNMNEPNGGALPALSDDTEDDDDVFEIEEELEKHAAAATVLNVVHTALKPFFSLFFSYFVCLSCFPGIISIIPSVTLKLGDWFPIILVGCFNLGDVVGRNLPAYVMYFDVSTLHFPWPFQLSFLPLFIATLARPLDDIITIVTVLLLGFTTGYVATSSIILAPGMCSEYQKEVAGMVGGLSSIIGLCAGSYNGLALEAIVQFWTGNIP